MGLADVFAARRLPFNSPEALALSTRIAEEIALAATPLPLRVIRDRNRGAGAPNIRLLITRIKGPPADRAWAAIPGDAGLGSVSGPPLRSIGRFP